MGSLFSLQQLPMEEGEIKKENKNKDNHQTAASLSIKVDNGSTELTTYKVRLFNISLHDLTVSRKPQHLII